MCCCDIWSKIARAHRRRRHAIDADAGLRELLAERFREPDDRRLRRAVGRRVRVALLAGDRRDVDDAPVAVLQHVRHDGAVAVEEAVDVDVDHLPPRVDGIFPRRTFGPVMPAEQTSMSMRAERTRRGVGRAATAAASATSSACVSALPAELRPRRRERRGIAVPERDGGAARREAPRDREADARGAAGDHGRPVAEIELVHSWVACSRRRAGLQPIL